MTNQMTHRAERVTPYYIQQAQKTIFKHVQKNIEAKESLRLRLAK